MQLSSGPRPGLDLSSAKEIIPTGILKLIINDKALKRFFSLSL